MGEGEGEGEGEGARMRAGSEKKGCEGENEDVRGCDDTGMKMRV